MKRLSVLLMVCSLLVTSGCRFKKVPTIKGSGTVASETRSVTGFSKLVCYGVGEVRLVQADEEGLDITTDDNLMAHIPSEVRGDTLHVGPRKVHLDATDSIQYVLRFRDLQKITANGALSVKGEDLVASSFKVTLNGACGLELTNLTSSDLTVTANGVGKVTLIRGQLPKATVTLNGAGHFDGSQAAVANLSVATNGAGSAEVWATDKLDARISGTGAISYYGTPQISQSVAGLGRVKSLGKK